MSPKKKNQTSQLVKMPKRLVEEPPRKRKTITLEMKLQILNCLEKGERVTFVGKKFGFNEATIRTIRRKSNAIRKSINCATTHSAKSASYIRHEPFIKMENILVNWLKDLKAKKSNISGNLIKEKALQIYEQLHEMKICHSQKPQKRRDFAASDGWLSLFLKRNPLHNLRMQESIETTEDPVKQFPLTLANIIKDVKYRPEQIFNADELNLLWKKIPKQIFTENQIEIPEATIENYMEDVNILLCYNASGDKMLKPLLIHQAINSRELNGKRGLPVHYMSNENGQMTAAVFEEWLQKHFIPEVKPYLKEQCLEFKVLLILNEVPHHPHIEHSNVQILYMKPNISSSIQPLEQGIKAEFQLHYAKVAFQHILDRSTQDKITFVESSRKYSLIDCIHNVALAQNKMNDDVLNASWKLIWPSCVRTDNHTDEQALSATVNLPTLDDSLVADGVGDGELKNLKMEVFEDFVFDKRADETNTMMGLDENNSSSDEADEGTQLSASLVLEGLTLGKHMVNHFMRIDTNVERAKKFAKEFKQCLKVYKELCKELQQSEKTSSPTSYYQKTTAADDAV